MSALLPELWLLVFSWLALPNAASGLGADYEPFDRTNVEDYDRALNDRRSLALVCRAWHELLDGSMYSDLRIRRGAAFESLLDAVVGDDPEPDEDDDQQRRRRPPRGPSVRRIELPYGCTTTERYRGSRALETHRLLSRCPNLTMLVRPGPYERGVRLHHGVEDEMRFEFPAPCAPHMPNLSRIEWWHQNEAARSGGLNALEDVLRHAPNVQHLVIGGHLRLDLAGFGPSSSCAGGGAGGGGDGRVRLERLQTLRLRHRMNRLFVHKVCAWDTPALTRVVLDSTANDMGSQEIWLAFGARLELVELGRNVCFLLHDHISECLSSCPSLLEFNYHLFFCTTYVLDAPHGSLRTIRLHAEPNIILDDNDPVYWTHVISHLRSITRARFPKLERTVLHGPAWTAKILRDGRIRSCLDGWDRSIALELAEGEMDAIWPVQGHGSQ